MNVTCGATTPCPVILNSTCVFYEGANLIYTGINTNDNLQTALEKIDANFADIFIGGPYLPLSGGTLTGGLIFLRANNTGDGAGQIYLNGANGNRIDWAAVGVNPPTLTTRSVGTKLVLYPSVSASLVDYAIGIENGATWFSVPSTSSAFKFYGGITVGATLTGAGALTLSSTATATSFIPTDSTIPINGMYLPAANTLGFSTNSTLDMSINPRGDVGVGVSSSPWGLGRSLEIGFAGNSVTGLQEGDMLVTEGVYFGINTVPPRSRTNVFVYTNSNYPVSVYRQFRGEHLWFYGDQGTLGTVANLTIRMYLYTSGNLAIQNGGTFTDSGERLQVTGNAKITGTLTINTSGQGTTISTFYGANSLGLNIFIGGGGASSVGAVGLTYQGSSNTSLGVQAFLANTIGHYNVAVGYRSLYANTTGYQNTGGGYFSLYTNTDGFRNTAFGLNTLVSNTTGSSNTAIGFRAGGTPGGLANTTGSNNIFIGNDITGVSPTESNRTWIGSSATTSTWLAGNLLLGSTANSGQRLQVTGTSLFAGNVSLTLNQNGVTLFNVTNTTAGTISFASIRTTSSNGYFEHSKQSSSTNAYKIFAANDSYLYNVTTGDISILNDVAAGRIKFAAGGSSVAQMTLTSAGNLCIGVTSGTDLLNIGASTATRAQINLTAGVAPTLPNDGDIWFDGTDLKMQIGGVVKTFTLV